MFSLAILGQILFGIYWLKAGIDHFRHLNMMAGYATSKSIPMPKIAVGGSGALLIIGGVSVLLGLNIYLATIPLIIFIIPTTLMIHNFWKAPNAEAGSSDKLHFMKNLALLGALLILLNLTALPYSIF